MSVVPVPAPRPRVTASSLTALKAAGRPITVITAYDYHAARIAEKAGVEVILVGDSLGMTMLGHASTLPVTMDDMVRATAAVSRATSRTLVVADMPFMSYQPSVELALTNAGRLLAEGGAHAVKLEGASETSLMVTQELTDAGVPVMGHVGLTPQSVNTLGGYHTQAKDAAPAAKLLEDCRALEDAGAFAIVLECIPAELATRVSELLTIPTIGIGAGVGCDGQVQVYHDLLGLGDFLPKHARRYADLDEVIGSAIEAYAEDVRSRAFPGEPETTHVSREVVAEAELLFSAEYDDEDLL
ncbi:MAG: 3-methyl-2-oxobutanoate hydroxymethyltransferase [Actinobacteria bacterium HGW-Actinobacteria-7]|nr:MAG: 3-methyl-2-oxobutanoate hydroxymethyltransferase [Actinobacteria bacterium HGW-Actinobacteria-7]